MTHYQLVGGTNRATSNPLLEQVFSILDSRIQFIDYQVQRYFNSCTQPKASQMLADDNYCGPSGIQVLMHNFDDLLQYTVRLHDDLKLLQVLRSWLKDETVHQILDLMTDNKYLNYSTGELEHLLRGETVTFRTFGAA